MDEEAAERVKSISCLFWLDVRRAVGDMDEGRGYKQTVGCTIYNAKRNTFVSYIMFIVGVKNCNNSDNEY